MVHEIWLFTLVHILIERCGGGGATVIQVQATTMVILSTLDDFTLVDDGMKGSGFFSMHKVNSEP